MTESEKIAERLEDLKAIKWASRATAVAQADIALQTRKQNRLLEDELERRKHHDELERQRRLNAAEARRALIKLEELCVRVERLDPNVRWHSSNARYFVELGLRMNQLDASEFEELVDIRSHADVQRRFDAISTACEADGGARLDSRVQSAADAVENLVRTAIPLNFPENARFERFPISRAELDKANAGLDEWAKTLPTSLRIAIDAGIHAISVGAVVSGEHEDQVELNNGFLQLPSELQPLLTTIIRAAHRKSSDSQLVEASTRIIEDARLGIQPYNEALNKIRELAVNVLHACAQGNKADAEAGFTAMSNFATRIDLNSIDEYKEAKSSYKRRWRTRSRLLVGALITLGFLLFLLLLVSVILDPPQKTKLQDSKEYSPSLKDIPPSISVTPGHQSPTANSAPENMVPTLVALSEKANNSTEAIPSSPPSSSAEQLKDQQRLSNSDKPNTENLQTRFGTLTVKEGRLTFNNRPVLDRNNVPIASDIVVLEKAITLSDTDVILVRTNCRGPTCHDHADTRFLSITAKGPSASQSFGYGLAIESTTKATPVVTIDYGPFGRAIYDNGNVEIAPSLIR
ncbi:MAG: hypothetical protein ABL985_09350 [Casimicrobium sp.]